MKGSTKKGLLKGVINTALSLGKGLVSIYNPAAGAVIGAVKGVKDGIDKEKAANLASPIGGEGNPDYAHITGAVVFIGLAVAFGFGYLSMDDVKALLKLFLKTQ